MSKVLNRIGIGLGRIVEIVAAGVLFFVGGSHLNSSHDVQVATLAIPIEAVT